VSVHSFRAPRLTEDQLARWREFTAQAPAAHYLQEPAWAEVERRGTGLQARRPYFFWCERDGSICLTALGVRRRLPIPGRVFWEFDNGPTVLEPSVLDEWLPWLLGTVRHENARLSLQPALPLDEVGDQVETILDAHGFVRRRTAGIWSTLVVDLDRPDDEIMASFRPRYRTRIRQSEALGIVVAAEDTLQGWLTLAKLDAEMATRTPVRPVDVGLVETISRLWCAGGSGGTVLVARHEGEPLAAILVIVYRSTAHLRMMPSSRRNRKLSTSHLLLWEAMRWAKAHGCKEFDLDGYNLTARPDDALWGVNEFKRGFAPKRPPAKFVAVHERVLSPLIVNSATAVRRVQAWQRRRNRPSEKRGRAATR
jgi:lipid II:glycine glycyltransferase (peptidoglycan interpeptide bridge formation enzyme)